MMTDGVYVTLTDENGEPAVSRVYVREEYCEVTDSKLVIQVPATKTGFHRGIGAFTITVEKK